MGLGKISVARRKHIQGYVTKKMEIIKTDSRKERKKKKKKKDRKESST